MQFFVGGIRLIDTTIPPDPSLETPIGRPPVRRTMTALQLDLHVCADRARTARQDCILLPAGRSQKFFISRSQYRRCEPLSPTPPTQAVVSQKMDTLAVLNVLDKHGFEPQRVSTVLRKYHNVI